MTQQIFLEKKHTHKKTPNGDTNKHPPIKQI